MYTTRSSLLLDVVLPEPQDEKMVHYCSKSDQCLRSSFTESSAAAEYEYNISSMAPTRDGSFTVDDSNSFFRPYKILSIAQENTYVGIFFLILSWNCMLCVLIRIASL